jgi:hypothetical protein
MIGRTAETVPVVPSLETLATSSTRFPDRTGFGNWNYRSLLELPHQWRRDPSLDKEWWPPAEIPPCCIRIMDVDENPNQALGHNS